MNYENKLGSQDQRTWATYGLVALNTIGFIIVNFSNAGVDFADERIVALGAMHPLPVWNGEVWRFFTAIFLHSSVFHFVLNTALLLQIGRMMEPLIGGARLVFLYLFVGAFGFAISIMSLADISIGSTNAMFGLLGGMLAIYFKIGEKSINRNLLKIASAFVVLSLFLSFARAQIVSGMPQMDVLSQSLSFLLGTIVCFAFLNEASKWRRTATASLVFVMLGFFVVVATAIRPQFLVRYHEISAIDDLLSKDYPASLVHAKWLEESKSSQILGKIISARVAANLGEKDRAYQLARQAQASSKNEPMQFWNVALRDLKIRHEGQSALFSDERGNAILCGVVINAGLKDSEILKDCAWLLLMARDRTILNPKLALELALSATSSSEKAVSFDLLRVLAEAYLQNGKYEEANHVINRALIDGGALAVYELEPQRRRIAHEIVAN